MTGAEREARASEILTRRQHRSNEPFATDVGRVTRRSSHARAFEQVYGRKPASVEDAAALTGIPQPILAQVYARGMAAWQTGHRPGASQHAWALARVQSFATGGPTALGPDADLAAQVGKRRNPEYPMAGPKVSGLEVVTPVPDMDSISGSLDEYTILPGIREVPLSDFSLTGRSYSVKRSEWIELLANKIADNGWIAPLIVVVDRDGPYILEGGSRSEALFRLGVKTMPAVVVIDEGNPPAERNPTKSSRHSRR